MQSTQPDPSFKVSYPAWMAPTLDKAARLLLNPEYAPYVTTSISVLSGMAEREKLTRRFEADERLRREAAEKRKGRSKQRKAGQSSKAKKPTARKVVKA